MIHELFRRKLFSFQVFGKNFVFLQFFFFFWPQCAACRILVSQPDIEPGLSVVRAHSFNHWPAREFLKSCFLKIKKNVLFPVLFLVVREYTPYDLDSFF